MYLKKKFRKLELFYAWGVYHAICETKLNYTEFDNVDGSRARNGNVTGMKQKEPGNSRGQEQDNLQADPLGVNSEIGRKLKQYYGELLTPVIPDRFSQLLRELEKCEQPQPVVEE